MMKNYLVFGLVLTLVVFLSGCLSLGPEALAFANPLIKQFMEEYPNAQIQVTYYTAIQSIPILENITSECGKNVSAKEYYVIKIDDPDSGLKVTAWIDWENRRLECAVKYGTGEDKSISKPGEPIKTCKSHAEFKCYGDHVFWFDSCGHKQEKKEYCQQGCELGFCKEREIKTCGEMGGYCVYPVLTAASITGMIITGQPIAAQPVCIDSDNGKNYHERGHVFTGESKLWDHCNDDGTLTEKYCTEDGQMAAVKVSCPAGGKCEDGICVGGKGETSEQEEIITDLVCKEGYAKAEYWCPENGICCAPKKTECESHYQYKCYEGHVFWFDSCGNMQEKKYYCEHGCEEGKCRTCTKIMVTRAIEGGLGIEPAKYEISFEPKKKIEFCGTVKNKMDVSTTINLFDDGYLEEFGTLSVENVYLNPLESEEFTYTLDLPEELEPGEHETILYAADPIETQEIQGVVARVKVGMRIIIKVPYPGEEECRNESYECTIEDIPCCEGLKEVPYGGYDPSTGQCIAATCGHVCGPCGNGICDENEDWCVCPEDCDPLCTDSDEGEDYYVKGKLTYGNFTDYDNCVNCTEEGCKAPENCTGPKCYVNEGFCDPEKDYNGMPLWFDQSHKCPYGCKDGACLVGCEGIEMVWFVEGEEVRRDPDCDSDRSNCYNCGGFCYSFASDSCPAYRCLTGNEINPSCYTFQECIEACDNECVYIPLAKEQCETI